jgi:hypothetical protein
MASQIARLYLRGALCNKTLRNLSASQVEEIEQIIDKIIEDPNLQQCRREFCNALARTIRNEYSDTQVGEQDYRIAIMRAAVAAKHGWGKEPPATEALLDPVQRKKFFQTWAFNYLRQILRENKIPAIKKAEKVSVGADQAALDAVRETMVRVVAKERDVEHRRYLRAVQEQTLVSDTEDGFALKFDHWSFPIQLVLELRELASQYVKWQVSIIQTMDGVEVKRLTQSVPTVEVVRRTNVLIREASFDAGDDEECRRDQLEMERMNKGDIYSGIVDEEDILGKLKQSIPTDARSVLEVYMESSRPEAFTKKYGPGYPKAVHVAEFLHKSPKEVKNLLRVIKFHCIALGIGK